MNPCAKEARECLFAAAAPQRAAMLARFFKTGVGEYGEGDVFIGVYVPDVRRIAREFAARLSPAEVLPLLADPVHECRLLALLIWTLQYPKADEKIQDEIFSLYLAHTKYIYNWDLVDLSARQIVGAHLLSRDRSLLDRLAASTLLWEQRIAIVATFEYIRKNDFVDTLRIADKLLTHKHDLIQKAVGWMLREVGKRDKPLLVSFLEERYTRMPRTMLRYAIERFPADERARFLRK